MGLARLLKSPNGAASEQNGKSRVSKSCSRLRVALAALAVLNAALLVLALRPPGRSLVERQKQYQQSRMRYDATIATVKQMRDLQSKLQSAIENNRAFARERFLDRGKAFSAMVADLEKLATESQLKPSTVAYVLKDDTKQPGFVNVSVTIALEGAYPDMVRFINRLEQSQLFWMIGNVNVTGSSAPGRGLRLSLTMETYAVAS
jgi:type II secretion system (T2SS) protein M